MATVAVIKSSKRRGRVELHPYIVDGFKRCGYQVIEFQPDSYKEPCSDIIAFYGMDGRRGSTIHRAFCEYRTAGLKAIYIDLGYWGERQTLGRYNEYHRISINERHCTADFQRVKHSPDRFARHGIPILPWRDSRGQNVLVYGMSEKAANFEGFEFEQWERAAIATLQQHTKRPIIYRPKPQRIRKGQYPPIEGVGYSNPVDGSGKRVSDFRADFKNAWAVVSHHSNVGIHAILAGIPCFQPEGVASVMGYSDLSLIETPKKPTDEERKQFGWDVAYWQWNREEMKRGLPWRMFKDEGLIP